MYANAISAFGCATKQAERAFRNYWYPVTWSRRIGRRPVSVQLLGDRIMFRREKVPQPARICSSGVQYRLVEQLGHSERMLCEPLLL